MIVIYQAADPQAAMDSRLSDFATSSRDSEAFALDYHFVQEYLPGAPEQRLLAVILLEKDGDGIRVSCSVSAYEDSLVRGLNCLRAERRAVQDWSRDHGCIWLHLDRPIALQPVQIPKPWGQEIWYTGIEERGQSRVADDRGREIPLPWLLSLCSRQVLGEDIGGKNKGELILLKILDPLPEPVFGDLYFEMHEEKREVYVVTHVDERAWPRGVGGIRFGFSQDKRASLSDDEAFKEAYLSAVTAYRAVREKIDAHLDVCRERDGIALDAPVAPATLRHWLAEVPASLREEEASLRASMESFIHVDPLQVGDVVKVPCFTPHSLLHGVRTVEFQTPVYERKILSFAQKVLTQKHWDTAAALERISLDPPERVQLPVIASGAGYRVEEVAVFEDFRVERIHLEPGAECRLDTAGRYSLLMGVAGDLQLNQCGLPPEQARLISAATGAPILANPSAGPGIALLARPVR